LGYGNVEVKLDDGTLGLPGEAPFDAIIVTAGAESLPPAYEEQLADGGRLIIPVGPSAAQQMIRVTRLGERTVRENLGSFGFVPLVSGTE
jgi:protein-L-isoaspartate(D-aspartate) O-methyltransferase